MLLELFICKVNTELLETVGRKCWGIMWRLHRENLTISFNRRSINKQNLNWLYHEKKSIKTDYGTHSRKRKYQTLNNITRTGPWSIEQNVSATKVKFNHLLHFYSTHEKKNTTARSHKRIIDDLPIILKALKTIYIQNSNLHLRIIILTNRLIDFFN